MNGIPSNASTAWTYSSQKYIYGIVYSFGHIIKTFPHPRLPSCRARNEIRIKNKRIYVHTYIFFLPPPPRSIPHIFRFSFDGLLLCHRRGLQGFMRCLSIFCCRVVHFGYTPRTRFPLNRGNGDQHYNNSA